MCEARDGHSYHESVPIVRLIRKRADVAFSSIIIASFDLSYDIKVRKRAGGYVEDEALADLRTLVDKILAGDWQLRGAIRAV